jgi:hypothetical protein
VAKQVEIVKPGRRREVAVSEKIRKGYREAATQ